jgi:hypothetical protein
VIYNGTRGAYGAILEEKDAKQPNSHSPNNHQYNQKDTETIYKMQCFPLYSLLLAIGRTHVDYFGLDVEGSEYKILKTVPWHKVDIKVKTISVKNSFVAKITFLFSLNHGVIVKTVTAEWNHTPEGEEGLTRLMESNRFTKIGLISNPYSKEVVFIQNSFNIYQV